MHAADRRSRGNHVPRPALDMRRRAQGRGSPGRGLSALLLCAVLGGWAVGCRSPESYRRECLESCVTSVETQSLADSPIRARLACVSETPDGLTAHVDHLLLRLPRRS